MKRKMPVAVPHGVFEHHGILVPQSLRERRKVKKRFNIGQILRHDALLARCAHMDACVTAVFGQPVHLPLACNLLIMTRMQVDAVDRIIDLADSRDDLVARTALLKSSFQRVLVLALLLHDLIHAAGVQQDLKARFRLLHPRLQGCILPQCSPLRSRADVLLASCACLLCGVYTCHKYAKLVIVCLL